MSSSSDEEIDESCVPSQEVCQERCNSFVSITETDQALAQYYLQRNGWIVKRAVIKFLAQQYHVKVSMDSTLQQATTVPPDNLTFISWNIDGLDESNLKARTMNVCRLILQDQPDIVFLQEVVPESLRIFKEHVFEYHFCEEKNYGYFNVTMLRIYTIRYDSHQIVPLQDTKMNRNMLTVQAHIGTLKFVLMNVHLESTRAHTTERVAQLRDGFTKILSFPPDVTAIFAGDMNLRDREVVSAGNIPPGVDDVWQKCGERRTAQYTWDLKMNTNKQMPSAQQPRMRFDRIYIKYSEPKTVKPRNFCIIGVEKVPNLTCFPSDHWGIRSEFDMSHPAVED